MSSSIPTQSGGAARPPADPPQPPMSVRDRLFGAQSMAYIAIILVSLGFTVLGAPRPAGDDAPSEILFAGILVGDLLSGSADSRVRAGASGLVAGIVLWVSGLPIVVAAGGGLAAAWLMHALDSATADLDSRVLVEARSALPPLIRRIVILKLSSVALTAGSVSLLSYHVLLSHGVTPALAIGVLMVGVVVYAHRQIGEARGFDASVVGHSPAA